VVQEGPNNVAVFPLPEASEVLFPLPSLKPYAALGEIVCWAGVLTEQANATAKPNNSAPAYLKTVLLEVLVTAFTPVRQK
jgi:hypothetical protein